MNYEKMLKKIEDNEMTAQEAFDKLYPVSKSKPGKRASFIKMNIKIPDEGKGLNTFLRILFAIPIPMIFARLGLRIANRFAPDTGDVDLDFAEISKLLKYSKNTKVQVDSNDAQIDIRIV
jgi:hypothetical protein